MFTSVQPLLLSFSSLFLSFPFSFLCWCDFRASRAHKTAFLIEEEDWERVEIVTIGVGIRAKEVMFAGGGEGVYNITFSLPNIPRTRRKVSNAQETALILNHAYLEIDGAIFVL